MPHPKKRKTKSGTRQRRSHHALKRINLTNCKKCGKPVKSHFACSGCGYYNGRKAVDVLKRLPKRERKNKNRELKEEKGKIDK